jgi:hypothetical protein
MKLVFRISEDGSEIELKHCASSKTSVKSSRKYFVHLKGGSLGGPQHRNTVQMRSRTPHVPLKKFVNTAWKKYG